MGFSLLGLSGRQPVRAFTRAPPTRFRESQPRGPRSPASRSVDRLSPGPARRPKPEWAEQPLQGFRTSTFPNTRTGSRSGLFGSPSAASHIAADCPGVFGSGLRSTGVVRDTHFRCRTFATSSSRLENTSRLGGRQIPRVFDSPVCLELRRGVAATSAADRCSGAAWAAKNWRGKLK